MKSLLTALSVLTIGITTNTLLSINILNKNNLNNYSTEPFITDGKDYIGDKVYDVIFYQYINHETFSQVENIYKENLPITAILKLNQLFKTFAKEKSLPFKEADYERLSAAIYDNFSRIYMINKQSNVGVKIKIGFNQADFLVTDVSKQ